jgi:tetratricopeptide (TPR) repeat protein
MGRETALACRDGVPDEQVERYALGQLDEAATEAFEDHYFGCPECLMRLETLQTLPRALQRRARRRRSVALRRPGLPVWVGVAASVAAVATAWLGWRLTTGRPGGQATTPSTLPVSPPHVATDVRRVVEWARITPPRFQAPSLRGPGEESREFEAAMDRFARSDYAGAISGLEEVVRRNPDDAAATFFLGASYLLSGRRPAGIVRLEEVVALGESPYLEEARLYLARALVHEGRVDDAAAELQKVLELRGDFENEAREGLDLIRESRPRRE